jgi:hypothetical protein
MLTLLPIKKILGSLGNPAHIFFGPSGYSTTPLRAALGRFRDGRVVDTNGDNFTEGGPEATFFAELPQVHEWIPVPEDVNAAGLNQVFVLAASIIDGKLKHVAVARYYPEYRPLNPWQTHSNDAYSDAISYPVTHYLPLIDVKRDADGYPLMTRDNLEKCLTFGRHPNTGRGFPEEYERLPKRSKEHKHWNDLTIEDKTGFTAVLCGVPLRTYFDKSLTTHRTHPELNVIHRAYYELCRNGAINFQ